jgi:2-(1,2-epoxy-1,2-dihydrophenyl)acetyl-CoA isomerase
MPPADELPAASPAVTYALDGRVATIRLVDPAGPNALNHDSLAALLDAVRQAASDEASVVALRSRGDFFSVGGDLRSFAAADDLPAYVERAVALVNTAVLELVRLDAVVVAVVQGAAAGAGFPLAAAADLVLAAESARFSLGYTRIGLSVDGGTSLFPTSLGLHRALRLALLNDVLSAQEAQAAGLVARVVPDGRLDAVADELIAGLASGPHSALAATKRLLRESAQGDPEPALRREALAVVEQASHPDGSEGIGAFVERRPPAFGGR